MVFRNAARVFLHIGLKTTLAMNRKIFAEPLLVSRRRRQMCANNFGRLFSLSRGRSKLTNGETHCLGSLYLLFCS